MIISRLFNARRAGEIRAIRNLFGDCILYLGYYKIYFMAQAENLDSRLLNSQAEEQAAARELKNKKGDINLIHLNRLQIVLLNI